ncbi:D-ribose pyranase [Actinoallomurus sp. NPDC052274]|uniref:D-ribose pyranase n=1 Tax=Actinoallomurus sp. NPDC052274 TaxID=3155420 RepID=UPI003444923E
MKRGGILNGALSGALARLGHTDQVLICDSGMPIPAGAEVVDLAFTLGIPGFAEVLDGILTELVVEGAVAAEEVVGGNPECHALLDDRLPALTYVPHEELKLLAHAVKLVVRTGEATPFANVILRCGVAF